MGLLGFYCIAVEQIDKIDNIRQKYLVGYAVISNNNIVNYWLSLYSKCSPFA